MDSSSKKERVVATFPFLSEDSRWSGEVQIIEREQKFDDGNVRTFSDRRLKIGDRYIALPRRGLDDVIKAMRDADEAGSKHYQELMARLNTDQKRFDRPPNARPPEQRGRRRNEETEE